jgi:ribosomal protein S18 acetylase RimI-like enzyme
MRTRFEENASPDIAQAAKENCIAVVPLCCIEQHRPHLPVNCDYGRPIRAAELAGERHGAGVLVLPALPYGPAAEHTAFAGTISLSFATWSAVVVEILQNLVRVIRPGTTPSWDAGSASGWTICSATSSAKGGGVAGRSSTETGHLRLASGRLRTSDSQEWRRMSERAFEIRICQPLQDGELYAFYKRNHICEEGYGKERSEIVLKHEGVWVAVYADGDLIGFARALHDGLHGQIMEIDLDLRYQTENAFRNGCFVESDPHGIAGEMAAALLKELRRRGCCFFSAVIYEGSAEKEFYRSLGFYENSDHRNYIIDARPYVPGGEERGAKIDGR